MHLLVITQPSQMGFIEGCSPQQHHSQGPTNGSFINSPPSVGSPGSRNNNTNHVFTVEYMELQDLTKRWRWALRLAERGAGGRKGLMSSSLRRVEALFTEWQIGRQDIRRDQRANWEEPNSYRYTQLHSRLRHHTVRGHLIAYLVF